MSEEKQRENDGRSEKVIAHRGLGYACESRIDKITHRSLQVA
jgi:hypothetical protein